MRRHLLHYSILLVVSIVGLLALLSFGARLQPPVHLGTEAAASTDLAAGLRETLADPLSRLLLQIVVIVVAARLAGKLFRRMGQPAVIGEMVAGILLGPSLLGLLFPDALAFLFPASSLGTLKLFSQVGVILFMFLVGMDLDLRHLREKAHAAVMVSHASILLPMLLGVALALFIYGSEAPAGVAFTSFALFMGIAMSITAFPVLARILDERGLSKTPLGTTSIACAAVDDVTAWCLLAVVLAIARSNGIAPALLTIGLAL